MNSSCAGEVRTGGDKKRRKKKWGQGYTNYAYYYHEAYGKRLASDADESREQGQHEPRIAIRDWNNEFQTIVSDLARCGDDDGKLERCNMLSSLAHGTVMSCPADLLMERNESPLHDILLTSRTYLQILCTQPRFTARSSFSSGSYHRAKRQSNLSTSEYVHRVAGSI